MIVLTVHFSINQTVIFIWLNIDQDAKQSLKFFSSEVSAQVKCNTLVSAVM